MPGRIISGNDVSKKDSAKQNAGRRQKPVDVFFAG
jgi:hypothetical protein